ncbi:hypothetical protein NUW54_g3885 [Trametes sanguinea]|uniref:Uncharacterized protein n=1 Tax=Trametes sanguinea TaxID=158606 RepID=A0ACC1Q315_9APHY|nr:hypothetical protein NUW54_g3885 [Trametes sanguinea]
MPERAEIFVQHKQVLYFIQHTDAQDRRLQAIWVDPTSDEQAKSSSNRLARAGLSIAFHLAQPYALCLDVSEVHRMTAE